MTQGLLHIRPGQSLDPDAGEPVKLDDPDARKLHRKAAAISIFKGFLSSPSFDTYMVMVCFTLAGISLPDWSAQITRPFSAANAFCSMLMVGMLMDLPGGRDDVKSVLQILAWRLPFGILFATAAWYLLPFEPLIRQAVALCCLAPTAVFATMFTDKVLGNARLAGFTLALTAVIGAVLMVLAHLLMGAI